MKLSKDEFLRQLIGKINSMGEQVSYSVMLQNGDVELWEAKMSNLRINDVSNLYESAPKELDMKADCACFLGSVGKVEKVDVTFDYSIGLLEDESLDMKGSAQLTLYDFMAEYRITPEVIDKVEDGSSFHESGMLHLKLDELNLSAVDFPFKVLEGDHAADVKNLFEQLFADFLAPERPLEGEELDQVEQILNDSVVAYAQHQRLFEDTMEMDT